MGAACCSSERARRSGGAPPSTYSAFHRPPLKTNARPLLSKKENGLTASPFSFAAAIAMQNGKRDTELVVRARKPEENRFQK